MKIVQPSKGYRFSVEAVILSRFAALRGGSVLVDLGCGSGVVGLCLLHLLPDSRLVGIDVIEDHIARARVGASLNGWSERARFEVCDVRSVGAHLGKLQADLVVSNPPFRSPDSSKVSTDQILAVARNELQGKLKDFTDAASFVLRKGGSLCIVYPASRLEYLMESAGASGFNPVALRFIHPRVGERASFVLYHAVKGSGKSFSVENPLILHRDVGDNRKYSEEAEGLIGPGRQ